MSDAMSFPATVEEFMEKYKIVDCDHVYSNGMEMVPIFRMKQWFEHEASQNADTGKMVGDCISRQAAIEMLMNQNVIMDGSEYHNGFNAGVNRAQEVIRNLPPVQPKHGKWVPVTNGRGGHECDQCHNYAPSYASGTEMLSDFCPDCGADMRGGVDG